MYNDNVLNEIKKEMKLRNITEELLAKKVNIPLHILNKKLNGEETLEIDEFVDIISCLDLSVNRITQIYEKYKIEMK